MGVPLTAAAVRSCCVDQDRWLQPHLAVKAFSESDRWTCRVTQLVTCTHLWLAAWLSAVDKSRGSKSVEVQRVWEIYGARLQFVPVPDGIRLDDALGREDVSSALVVWSGAAESALAEAFCIAGGPVPDKGFGSWSRYCSVPCRSTRRAQGS